MLNLLLLVLGAGAGASSGIDDPSRARVVMLARVVDLNPAPRSNGARPTTIALSPRNAVVVQLDLTTLDAGGNIVPCLGATVDAVIAAGASTGAADPSLVAVIVERGLGSYIASIAGGLLPAAVLAPIFGVTNAPVPYLVVHEAGGLREAVPMTYTDPKLARLASL